MSRNAVERRLSDVTHELKRAREELAVVTEQHAALVEAAEEARIRAVVSETPLAEREHREAQRHVDAMARGRDDLIASITALQRSQDELLDRLVPDPS